MLGSVTYNFTSDPLTDYDKSTADFPARAANLDQLAIKDVLLKVCERSPVPISALTLKLHTGELVRWEQVEGFPKLLHRLHEAWIHTEKHPYSLETSSE